MQTLTKAGVLTLTVGAVVLGTAPAANAAEHNFGIITGYSYTSHAGLLPA